MQKRVFDTIEARHARDFGNGRAGQRLYEDLLSAVRESRIPEAATEFEKRFLPLLKSKQPDSEAEASSLKRAPRAAGGIWVSTLCGAAIILGALIVGFGAFKTTMAKSPVKTPMVDMGATQPTPHAIADPAPQTASDAPVTAANGPETTDETAAESAPTRAVEQEPPAR
jgi:hypothetical protein